MVIRIYNYTISYELRWILYYILTGSRVARIKIGFISVHIYPLTNILS